MIEQAVMESNEIFNILVSKRVRKRYLFQIVSFMQDLQGESKGLSIGGLVVITKDTSLMVKLFSRH